MAMSPPRIHAYRRRGHAHAEIPGKIMQNFRLGFTPYIEKSKGEAAGCLVPFGPSTIPENLKGPLVQPWHGGRFSTTLLVEGELHQYIRWSALASGKRLRRREASRALLLLRRPPRLVTSRASCFVIEPSRAQSHVPGVFIFCQ